MAGLGVERIAFLFVQHGANDVARQVDGLSRSLFRLQGLANNLGAQNSVAGNLAQTFGALTDAGQHLAVVGAGALAGASGVAKLTVEISKVGGHFIAAREQFDNTSSSMGEMATAFLPRLRTAMLGTVSDMDIMRLANFALSAGLKVSSNDFVRLAEASTKLAVIHGRDAPEALQRLTFGIIKQERRILDELGIVIKAKDVFKDYATSIHKSADELTAHEKVQAFFKATLSAAEEQTKSFSGVNFELASIGDRLAATFENFGTKLATMFVQGGFAERMFKALDGVMESILNKLSQPGQAEAFFGGLVRGATAVVQLAQTILQLLIDIAPYAERILKAFVGLQVGNVIGSLASIIGNFFGPVGALVGQGVKIAAPLVGAGVGFFGGTSPTTAGREISAAIEPRISPSEDQLRELTSVLRNQLYQGAPGYSGVGA